MSIQSPRRLAQLVFLAAVLAGVIVAGAPAPPGIFPKYLAAAAASPQQGAARLFDHSPLYLLLNRWLLPLGPHAVLWLQCGLHALGSVWIALLVVRLAGPRTALAAGLLSATYRPFLVYAGVHEPEAAIQFALSGAMLLGLRARRGEAGAGGPGPSALGAGACLGLASLLRPSYALLLPVWAAWVGGGPAPPPQRRRRAAMAGAAGLVVLAPVLLARGLAGGVPTLMNPGPVLYEGNGPTASGLVRTVPRVVRILERAHPEEVDYAHVAYRRIASHAAGRELRFAEANRYWSGLVLEVLGHHPAASLKRLGRKLLATWMPREGHDLRVAEDLDRRVRRRIPWGFGILLAALPALVVRGRWRDPELLGPLAVAALACLVQVLFYASARQRLPLALGLLVLGPVSLHGHEPRRLRACLFAGVLLFLGLGLLAGGIALADEAAWDQSLGPAPASPGEALAELHDGRLLRPVEARRLEAIARALARLRRGEVEGAVAPLQALAGRGLDLTLDDRFLAVPDYWLARVLLSRGALGPAREALRGALRARPVDPDIQALGLLLAEHPDPRALNAWRPAGIDPVSVQVHLAQAAWLSGRPGLARSLLAPLAADFPELAEPLAPEP